MPLSGEVSSGVLRCPVTAVLAGWKWTAGVARPRRTEEKSAEAIVPAGRKPKPGRAERTSRGRTLRARRERR